MADLCFGETRLLVEKFEISKSFSSAKHHGRMNLACRERPMKCLTPKRKTANCDYPSAYKSFVLEKPRFSLKDLKFQRASAVLNMQK